ncbi:MAG: alpha/beta hydrolase [Chloroflexi bacterium]|jgi:pimeloyl-ACP methyl ester carboxylesterase|nr:alpha/beta hydrolase [Chloroflexota bacterium]MBT5253395.1 alpha/beta hydrolase [Chloroflexota bacterium]
MPLLLNGFTDHTIDTGEIEIAYSVGPNNGPTLLLLHGVTSRRDGFLRVIDELVNGYRVVTMDQRGHGYSGHTPGAYDREDHARDIRFVLENVCKEPTIVWGHSMGGGNTVAMANNPPSNLKAVVLEDPAVFGRERPVKANNSLTMDGFKVHLDMIESGLSIDEMAPKLQAASPNQPDYFSRWKAECLLQMDADILRGVVGGTYRGFDDPAAMLANIQVPVLLLQADPDAGGILPDDYLAGILPNSDSFSFTKIVGAGHNLNREFPEKMLPVVLPWLAEQR